MTQEAQVMPVTCSLISENAAVLMGGLRRLFDVAHRQGSDDGKVNCRRAILPTAIVDSRRDRLTFPHWEVGQSAGHPHLQKRTVIAFQVNDMTCGHCVSTITTALKATDKDAKVQIDLATHRVQVEPTAPASKPSARSRDWCPGVA
jgi:hypothetical protein